MFIEIYYTYIHIYWHALVTADGQQQQPNQSKKRTAKQKLGHPAGNTTDNNNIAKLINNNSIRPEASASKGSGHGRKKKIKTVKPETAGNVIELTNSMLAGNSSKSGGTATTANTSSINSTTKAPPKINKTAEMLQTIPTVDDNNLDSVLKSVTALDNTCDYTRCRTKTSLIGQDCQLCQQRFCMKHQVSKIFLFILFKIRIYIIHL